jgi:hypothetical protein
MLPHTRTKRNGLELELASLHASSSPTSDCVFELAVLILGDKCTYYICTL